MTAITAPARPKRATAATFDMADGELAVMRPDHSGAVLLNAMGAVVWQLCDGTRTPEQIAEFICANVAGADVPRVAGDVAGLLVRLCEAGLVVDGDGAPCSPQPSGR